MKVNLKQIEIREALKQYISQQGINLTGKHVEMAFTAGRKDSGISVEISIEDVEIPGLDQVESVKPVLSVVNTPVAAVASIARDPVVAEVVAQAEVAVAAGAAAEVEEERPIGQLMTGPDESAPAVKTSSLFS